MIKTTELDKILSGEVELGKGLPPADWESLDRILGQGLSPVCKDHSADSADDNPQGTNPKGTNPTIFMVQI